MKKMSNKTKDILFFLIVIFVIVFTIFACGFWVGRSYAAEPILSEVEQYNKFCSEEQIKTEMRWLALKEYVATMSEEEYCETFFKDDGKEYEHARQNFTDR